MFTVLISLLVLGFLCLSVICLTQFKKTRWMFVLALVYALSSVLLPSLTFVAQARMQGEITPGQAVYMTTMFALLPTLTGLTVWAFTRQSRPWLGRWLLPLGLPLTLGLVLTGLPST